MLVAALLGMWGAVSPPASASVTAVVSATWDCDGTVTVTAEHHAISNIVVRDANGDTKIEEPFEQVDENGQAIEVFEYQFDATAGLEGVFVKAGNNGQRGQANRGYGELVPLTAPQDCGPVLGTGDVQATLTWLGSATSRDDWDLYVIDPSGERIDFINTTAASGGQLDHDAICEPNPSVENIFWPDDQAPAGQYTVAVDLFNSCGDGVEAEWHLTVTVDGVVVIDETGSGDSDPNVRSAGPENTFTFTYPSP